jgi:hypothetical protein
MALRNAVLRPSSVAIAFDAATRDGEEEDDRR